MIGIIDYGMGNLRSVQKAFEAAGLAAELTRDPAALAHYDGLVLPGVGAFAKAMENLEQLGLKTALIDVVQQGKPFLGICLGLQLLFSESEESFAGGTVPGLGMIPGRVVRFPLEVKVPQIGWNQIEIQQESMLLESIPQNSYLYFVHSYYVQPDDDGVVLTKTDYGAMFVSSIAKDNIYAIQFHPEKSSKLGLVLLRNFGEIVKRTYELGEKRC